MPEEVLRLDPEHPPSKFCWFKVHVQGTGDVPNTLAVGFLALENRPSYCDRGKYSVKVDVHNLNIDGADMFPRYYFHWDCLVKEVKAWMEARGLEEKHLEVCEI